MPIINLKIIKKTALNFLTKSYRTKINIFKESFVSEHFNITFFCWEK